MPITNVNAPSFDKYRPIPGLSSPLHKYQKSKNSEKARSHGDEVASTVI